MSAENGNDIDVRVIVDVSRLSEGAQQAVAGFGSMKRAAQSAAVAIRESGQAIDSAGSAAAGSMKSAGAQIKAAMADSGASAKKSIAQMRADFSALMADAPKAGKAVEEMSRAQVRALDRAAAAWKREKLAQFRQIDREQVAARDAEMASLRSDIQQRSASTAAIEAENAAALELSRSEQAEAAGMTRLTGIAGSAATAQAELGEQTTLAAVAQRTQNEAMSEGIPQYAATSAMVRFMEGNMNNMVRAAERFTMYSGVLQRAAMTAFPAIGAVALLDLLGRMGAKVVSLYQNFFELRRSIKAVGQAELDLARDSRQAQSAVESNIERILSDTKGQTAAVKQRLVFEEGRGIDLTSFFEGSDFKKETKDLYYDVNKHYYDQYRVVAPGEMFSRLAQAKKELRELREAASPESNVAGFYVKQVEGYGPGGKDPVAYYRQRATVLQQIVTEMQNAIDVRQSKIQATMADLTKAQEDASKKGGAAGGRSAIELARERLTQMQAQHAMSLEAQIAYWQKLADGVKKGSDLYRAYMLQANRDRAELWKQGQQEMAQEITASAAAQRAAQQSSDRVTASLTETWEQMQRSEQGAARRMLEAARQAFSAAQEQRQAADNLAAESIRAQYSRGMITRSQAAQEMAAIHGSSYADYMEAAAAWSKEFPNEAAPGAPRASQYYQKAAQSDAQAQVDASLSGSVRRMFDVYVQQATDTAAQITRILGGALESTNQSLSHALMAHYNNGWEMRRGITQAMSNTARGIGAQVLNAGFHQIEGGILSKFGFGAKSKPDGTSGNPLWVRMAQTQGQQSLTGLLNYASIPSGLSTVSKGVTSLIPSLLSAIPGFAAGGTIPANSWAVVGERGMELLPPVGHPREVIPNDAIGGGVGGDTHIHVDARGAHDPAAVEAAVQRGIAAAAPHIVAASVQSVHEQRMRMPSMKR